MRIPIAIALLVPLLAGCLADDPAPGTSPPPFPSSGGDAAPALVWASLEQATIRPGVQMTSEGGQCTSNFVFTSPDNRTVYLGFAAHCVGEGTDPSNTDGCDKVGNPPMALGSEVTIEGASAPARLAYTSWGTMQALNETDANACAYNDFAVVAIAAEDVAKVNPAMLHFGGPTGLADIATVAQGDKVLTFGNSGLRGGVRQLSPHEGYVLSTGADGWTTQLYTVTPGVPGDSGSGVLLGATGAALGDLVTVEAFPTPLANNASTLSKQLDYAKQKAGLDLRLATWELLDDGTLPPLP